MKRPAQFRSLRSALAGLALLCACAGSGLAQEKAAGDGMIYPRNAAPADAPAAPARPAESNRLLIMLAVAAAAAGGWLLWRQRQGGGSAAGAARKLSIAESRPLGNRQHLLVVDYDGRKFLLGVCPGRIELLTPLESGKKDGAA